jgi:L-glyceraldehyde reductase
LGISNFTIAATKELLKTAKLPIAANQIEAHPYLLQPELFSFLKDQNILPVAYSPLGNNIYNLPRYVTGV